jgi:hypothetical protein
MPGITRSFDDSPIHADAVASVARAAAAQGDTPKAIALFRAILSDHPGSAAANEALDFLVTRKVAAGAPKFETDPVRSLWPSTRSPRRDPKSAH